MANDDDLLRYILLANIVSVCYFAGGDTSPNRTVLVFLFVNALLMLELWPPSLTVVTAQLVLFDTWVLALVAAHEAAAAAAQEATAAAARELEASRLALAKLRREVLEGACGRREVHHPREGW